jgi:radical SAM protein with 4Fe4S-binding SPASM domain
MINVTKLYCNRDTSGDAIRYGKEKHGITDHEAPKSARDRKPVVVWNITKTCNLACIHCYTDSYNKKYNEELTADEAKKVITDLARFKIPSLLFSGGEPLMRKDIFELAQFAKENGIRPVLSTNGTLIDSAVAKKIKEVGFIYVGISLDGIGEINDHFRGKIGAFNNAIEGFRKLVNLDQRVGLRLTLTKHNAGELDKIFDFIEKEKINRACFYHLVYSGRGKKSFDLTAEEIRSYVDTILKRTKEFTEKGLSIDILTVDNHVDGVYLYSKLLKEDPRRAEDVYKLLKWNGGGLYSSGVGIGCIDNVGNVHPDQFWQHYTFGNVRTRKFSEIWLDENDKLMKGLKNRKSLLKGKCSRCKYIELCGGSFRVRADIVYNDPWQEDPACYLTEEEIK